MELNWFWFRTQRWYGLWIRRGRREFGRGGRGVQWWGWRRTPETYIYETAEEISNNLIQNFIFSQSFLFFDFIFLDLNAFMPKLFPLLALLGHQNSLAILLIRIPCSFIIGSIAIVFLAPSMVHIILPLTLIIIPVCIGVFAHSWFGIILKISSVLLPIRINVNSFTISLIVHIIAWVLVSWRVFAYPIAICFPILPFALKSSICYWIVEPMPMINIVFQFSIIVVSIFKCYFGICAVHIGVLRSIFVWGCSCRFFSFLSPLLSNLRSVAFLYGLSFHFILCSLSLRLFLNFGAQRFNNLTRLWLRFLLQLFFIAIGALNLLYLKQIDPIFAIWSHEGCIKFMFSILIEGNLLLEQSVLNFKFIKWRKDSLIHFHPTLNILLEGTRNNLPDENKTCCLEVKMIALASAQKS